MTVPVTGGAGYIGSHLVQRWWKPGESRRAVVPARPRALGNAELRLQPQLLRDRTSPIHAMLDWTPPYDDLETICAHALAWEQKLVREREGELPRRIGLDYGRAQVLI